MEDATSLSNVGFWYAVVEVVVLLVLVVVVVVVIVVVVEAAVAVNSIRSSLPAMLVPHFYHYYY